MTISIAPSNALFRLATCIAFVVGNCIGAAALADTDADSQLNSLQTIIVTARKVAENVQTVPATVEALSAEQIQNSDLQGLLDLSSLVPGININSSEPNHAQISIRGITSTSPSPTVGVFIDDVAVETTNHDLTGQFEPPTFDTARIEVLEGPQGTLYGGSSMGGAIKFVSAAPNAHETEISGKAQFAATTGGGTGYLGSVVFNLPVVQDQLALRVGLFHDEIPGYIDRVAHGVGLLPPTPSRPSYVSPNTTTAQDVNSYTVNAFRIAGAYAGPDTLLVTPQFIFQSTKSHDSSDYWPNLPLFQQSYAIEQPTEDRFMLGSVTINKSLGPVDLTSISSWLQATDATTRDVGAFMGTFIPEYASLTSPSFEGSTNHSVSQELRVASSDESSPVRFVAGAYYRSLSARRHQSILTYGAGVTEDGVASDVVYADHYTDAVKQKAVFGEATYRWRQLDFTAGGRGYWIDTSLDIDADGILNGGPSGTHVAAREQGFSPKVEISVRPTDDSMVYALANKGFRAGGPNGAIPQAACAPELAELGLSSAPALYHSDSLWNYEVGAKSTLLEDRLVLNASGFYMNWKQIQQGVTLAHCGFGFIGNVGAAVSKGIELQMRSAPITGLELNVGALYNVAEITAASIGTPAHVGDPVEESPRFVANGSIEYSRPVSAEFTGILHLDYQFHGSQTQSYNRTYTSSIDPMTGADLGAPTLVPDPSYLQPNYRIANASVGLRSRNWSTRILCENLANSHPRIGMHSDGALENFAYTLRPRTFKLEVSLRY